MRLMFGRVAALSTRLDAFKTATKTQFPGLADTHPDKEHLDAAIDWLDKSCEISAGSGSSATYNLILGWDHPYPETSGYIVPTLYCYADRTDEDQYTTRAMELAEWLLGIQHADGSFSGGTGAEGDPNVFNTGQIIFGLVKAYQRTGDDRFRTAAEAACDWLVNVQDAAGSWSQYDYKSTTHIYTTRVSWALLLVADIVPEKRDRYEAAAYKNLEWALNHQQENGWFEKASFEPGKRPYLHTIAYTIRGLIECGQHLESTEIYEAGKQTADRLLKMQREDGILKGAYDTDWSPAWFHCLPGNAQMGIIWMRLYSIEGDEDYLLAARNTAEFLKRHQPLSGPDAVRGGLPGSYPYVGSYIFLRYPNWGAKFLADLFLKLQAATSAPHPTQSTERGKPNETTTTAQSDSTQAIDSVETNDVTSECDTTEAPATTTELDTCRVCLLTDGTHVQRWAAKALAQMIEETNAEINLVVINEDAGLLGRGNIRRGTKYPAYAAYWIASEFLFDSETEAFDDSVHISEVPGVSEARWIRTYPANVDGLWCELPEEVVKTVSVETDLVVRRGFGLLTGDILTATEYGVLSYHHGDPKAYRGGPAGFWEFMHDTPRVGFMIQSLRDNLDAGIVQAYDEVNISDCNSWRAVQKRIYPNSTHLLAEAVERVQDPKAEPIRIEDHGPVYHPPSAADLGRFALKRALKSTSGIGALGGVI